jgi:type IX secretion system PorP/SprF family membrane protein
MLSHLHKIGIIALFFSLFFIFEAAGQQLPVYSQYMMNKFLINPAMAGSEGLTAINITAREQWIGMKNSPKTHALSFHTRLLNDSHINRILSVRRKSKRSSRDTQVGLGGYIFNDRNGLVSRTGLSFTYAYHIDISEGQLSFGLSGSIYQFKLDLDQMRSFDPGDLVLNNANNTAVIPDADFGVYYSYPTFYTGISVSSMLQSYFKFGKQGYENYRLKRQYHFIGGYQFKQIDNVVIEPNLLIRVSETPRFQTDMGAKAYFSGSYWGGISYRTGGALIFMAGVRVEKFYFGYSFDYTLSSLMRHSFGSHEFMLALILGGDDARRYRWVNQ